MTRIPAAGRLDAGLNLELPKEPGPTGSAIRAVSPSR